MKYKANEYVGIINTLPARMYSWLGKRMYEELDFNLWLYYILQGDKSERMLLYYLGVGAFGKSFKNRIIKDRRKLAYAASIYGSEALLLANFIEFYLMNLMHGDFNTSIKYIRHLSQDCQEPDIKDYTDNITDYLDNLLLWCYNEFYVHGADYEYEYNRKEAKRIVQLCNLAKQIEYTKNVAYNINKHYGK